MPDIALDKHFEVIMENCKELCKERFDTIDNNLKLAKVEMDRRLEGMNEFRSQLEKQAVEFVTDTEFKSEVKLLKALIISEGKGRISWGVALAITLLTTLCAILITMLGTYLLK